MAAKQMPTPLPGTLLKIRSFSCRGDQVVNRMTGDPGNCQPDDIKPHEEQEINTDFDEIKAQQIVAGDASRLSAPIQEKTGKRNNDRNLSPE